MATIVFHILKISFELKVFMITGSRFDIYECPASLNNTAGFSL